MTSPVFWRKNSKGPAYVDVRCAHGESKQSIDNLRRRRIQGCKRCFQERNGLFRFQDDLDRKLHKHYKSIYNRTTYASVNGYSNYGAAGITLCKEWYGNPRAFIDYVKLLPNWSPDKTLDRIVNEKGYQPGNLRWATPKEQAYNRRDTIKVEWNNEKLSFKTFVERYTDLSNSQALTLWHKGWTLQQLADHIPKEIGARVRRNKRRTKS